MLDQIVLFGSSRSTSRDQFALIFRRCVEFRILRGISRAGKKMEGAATREEGRILIREIFVRTAREIVVAVIIFRGIETRARRARNRIQDPYLTIKLNPLTWRRSCAKKYFTSCLYVSAVTLTLNPIFPIGSLVGIRC